MLLNEYERHIKKVHDLKKVIEAEKRLHFVNFGTVALLELLRGDGTLYDDLPFERSKEIARDFTFD